MREDFKDRKIELSKIHSEFMSSAKISECFYHKKDECKGKIKLAHSIQRNGRLSLIEEDVKGNKKLYSFIEIEISERTGKYELKPIGKAVASTFFGFCDYHDSMIFDEIENNGFIDNDLHCFLHAYRAFAHTHHRKIQQIKAFSSKTSFTDIIQFDIPNHLNGTEMGLDDCERTKMRFNKVFDEKRFSDLDTLVIRYPHFYPIACSAGWTPKYSPVTNVSLNTHIDPAIPYEYVYINVIPDVEGTILLLSCFPEDKKSLMYIDEFESLSSYRQNKILTSILIGEVENTFLSPYVYNLLTSKEKKVLVNELASTTIYSKKPTFGHFISKLNFFEPRFKKNI